MRVARFGRNQASRYRLEGVQYQNGQVSLANRPQPIEQPVVTAPVKKATQAQLENIPA